MVDQIERLSTTGGCIEKRLLIGLYNGFGSSSIHAVEGIKKFGFDLWNRMPNGKRIQAICKAIKSCIFAAEKE